MLASLASSTDMDARASFVSAAAAALEDDDDDEKVLGGGGGGRGGGDGSAPAPKDTTTVYGSGQAGSVGVAAGVNALGADGDELYDLD